MLKQIGIGTSESFRFDLLKVVVWKGAVSKLFISFRTADYVL